MGDPDPARTAPSLGCAGRGDRLRDGVGRDGRIRFPFSPCWLSRTKLKETQLSHGLIVHLVSLTNTIS